MLIDAATFDRMMKHKKFLSLKVQYVGTRFGSGANDLFDYGIKAAAFWTLDTEKVPISVDTFVFTVIAHNVDDASKVRWHGLHFNVSCTGKPCGCHGLLTDDSLFANGTSIIKRRKFPETMGMNGMTAGQILRRLSGRKHILPTHRTIILILVFHTIMIVIHTHTYAHTAMLTMSKILPSTHSTKSTIWAMKWLFGFIRHP